MSTKDDPVEFLEWRKNFYADVVRAQADLQKHVASVAETSPDMQDFVSKGCCALDLPYTKEDLDEVIESVSAKIDSFAKNAKKVKKAEMATKVEEWVAITKTIPLCCAKIQEQRSAMQWHLKEARSTSRKVYQKERWNKIKVVSDFQDAGFEVKHAQRLAAWVMKHLAAESNCSDKHKAVAMKDKTSAGLLFSPQRCEIDFKKPMVWMPNDTDVQALVSKLDAAKDTLQLKQVALETQLAAKPRWPGCQGEVPASLQLDAGFCHFLKQHEVASEEGGFPWMVAGRTCKKLTGKKLPAQWFPHMLVSYGKHWLVHLVSATEALSQGVLLDNIETAAQSEWLDKHSIAMWLPAGHILYVPMGWHPIIARMKVPEVVLKDKEKPGPKGVEVACEFSFMLSIPVFDTAAWEVVDQPQRVALSKHHRLILDEKAQDSTMWENRAVTWTKIESICNDPA